MSGSFLLTYSVLTAAATTWDNQAEELRAGHKRLTDAENAADDLGDRAGPVAATYLATWLEQVSTLAEAAQGRSDGLAAFARSARYFDQSAAAEIRASLPWDERDLSGPLGPPGVPGAPSLLPEPSPSPGPAPTPGPTP